MTHCDYLENAQAIQQDAERTQTQEEARRQLVEEGFITEDGELSAAYRE